MIEGWISLVLATIFMLRVLVMFLFYRRFTIHLASGESIKIVCTYFALSYNESGTVTGWQMSRKDNGKTLIYANPALIIAVTDELPYIWD